MIGFLPPEPAGHSTKLNDLGQNFGADLTDAEVRYLIRDEWARNVEDVLWRRTKQGLVIRDKADIAKLDDFIQQELSGTS